jgi:hypothetical protein
MDFGNFGILTELTQLLSTPLMGNLPWGDLT